MKNRARKKWISTSGWKSRAQQTSAEPSLEHERIAGVPRQIRPATKRIVAAVLAGSAVILVAGGLRVLRARQERLAEASRTPVASTLVATAKPIDVPPPPPTGPAMASAQGARERFRDAVHRRQSARYRESSANPTASTAPMVADVPPVAAMPATAVGAAMSRAVVAAPPRPAKIAHQREGASRGWIARGPGEPRARGGGHGARRRSGASGDRRQPGGRGRMADACRRLPGLRQWRSGARRVRKLRCASKDARRQRVSRPRGAKIPVAQLDRGPGAVSQKAVREDTGPRIRTANFRRARASGDALTRTRRLKLELATGRVNLTPVAPPDPAPEQSAQSAKAPRETTETAA